MKDPRLGLPDLGIGVGLRVPHYRHVLERRPAVAFFEIISENFMVPGGRPRDHLARVLETYQVVQHGVSLNVGGPSELDPEYLARLRALCRETRTPWVTDHFCWCGAGGAHLHDLLPLPYTRQALARVVERAQKVQDILELPFALENTSSYLTYRSSVLSEWEFVTEIADRAGIGLLLDVNNIYVSAYNHGFDPVRFIESVSHEHIIQVHLAGHTNLGRYIIDTHRGPIPDPVWDLYRLLIEHTGPVSTLIEWDDQIPAFPALMAEVERARCERDRALRARETGQSSVDRHAIQVALENARRAALAPDPGWIQGGPREPIPEPEAAA